MKASDDLSQIERFHLLSNVPIFAGISMEEQRILADKSILENREPNEIVIEQGEVGHCLYIILQGHVLVTVQNKSKIWKRITTLGPGNIFGEIAVIRNIPRTARISTIEACQFLTVRAEDFLEFYQYLSARARDNIQIVIAKRLQELGSFAYL